jgi:thioredoxin 1
MQPLTKIVVLAALAATVVLVLVGNRERRALEPDLLGLAAAAGAHADPVPAGYGPSAPAVPRLVAIGAGECIPCKAMAPIRAEIRREYAGVMAVDFYDVWKDPAAARHFGIRVIPTLIFYDASGGELGRREGYVAKSDIMAQWARWGVALRPAAG